MTPIKHICDALRNLVPFAQFKKREKHPWRSVTFSKVLSSNGTTSRNASLSSFSQSTPAKRDMTPNIFEFHVDASINVMEAYEK